MIERLEYAEEDDKIGTLQTSGTLLMVSINKQLIEVIRGEISAAKIVQDDWWGGFGFQRMKIGNAWSKEIFPQGEGWHIFWRDILLRLKIFKREPPPPPQKKKN